MTAPDDAPNLGGGIEDGRSQTWSGLTGHIYRACEVLDLRLSLFDPFGRTGLIHYPTGYRAAFKGTSFDINPMGAAQIARDKDYSARALRQAGLPTVPGRVLLAPRLINKLVQSGAMGCDQGQRFADISGAVASVGLPAAVKPLTGMEGDGVAQVSTRLEAAKAADGLFVRYDRILVQPWLAGRDIRVVVLDGEVLFACERVRPHVIGDGRRSIEALGTGGTTLDAGASRAHLARCGLNRCDVPKAGERVDLVPTANLSTGGSLIDLTDQLPVGTQALAVAATQALGLRFAGVDLIDPGASQPGLSVLEVNAAPGLAHAAATIGRDRVDTLYRQVIAAMGRGTHAPQ